MKNMEVPMKNMRKKKRLYDRLPSAAAPVIARRKGGQKAMPLKRPAVRGTSREILIFPAIRSMFWTAHGASVLKNE
jgi:hypothetical protein